MYWLSVDVFVEGAVGVEAAVEGLDEVEPDAAEVDCEEAVVATVVAAAVAEAAVLAVEFVIIL